MNGLFAPLLMDKPDELINDFPLALNCSTNLSGIIAGLRFP
jgi:hypothetical protein